MNILRRLAKLLRRRELDADMAEEMRHHLELQAERHRATGLNEFAAREAALRDFGNLAGIQQQAREQRPLLWLEQFGQDLRHAVRTLVKAPQPTSIGVLTLAVGIGLVAIQYSVVNGIRRGLPFAEAEKILTIVPLDLNGRARDATLEEFALWRGRQQSCRQLAAFAPVTLDLGGEGMAAHSYRGAAFSAGLLELLGVRPVMGRGFTAEDERLDAPPVLLLRRWVWEQRFASDPAVIGRVIRLGGEPATIIGVLPDDFGFPENQHVWVNLRPASGRLGERAGARATARLLGRLDDQVTLEAARAEFDLLVRRADQHQTMPPGSAARAAVRPVIDPDGGKAGIAALSLLGVVGGVLALAGLNVANLLSVRALQRGAELAVRSALGATRGRIVRQLLAESTLLALAGAGGGLLLMIGGIPLVNGLFARIPDKPFWFEVEADWRVFALLVVATMVVGVLVGLFPALQATRSAAAGMLKETAGGGGSNWRLGRVNRTLVVVQLALSSSLLLVTGIFLHAAWRAGEIGLSFNPRTVLSAQLRLAGPALADPAGRVRFGEQLLSRLRGLPGVTAATLTDSYPVARSGEYRTLVFAGEEGRKIESGPTLTDAVAAGFFHDLAIPLLEGREFLPEDGGGAERVAIINASLARAVWPGESAVGKRFRYRDGGDAAPWTTVVGVAADLASDHTPRTNARVHEPLRQASPLEILVHLRATDDPGLLARPLEEAVQSLSSDVTLDRVMTLAERFDEANGPMRAFSLLGLAFGAAGLFLAAVGVYSVTAFAVQRRTREFGIRIALGAKPADLFAFVFRQGAQQLGLGLALGALLGWAAGKPARAAVASIADSPGPLAYFGIMGGIVAVVALALWIPARRAAKADPMVALRAE